MMKYNEWKILQEAVAPSFSLGLKSYPIVGGPMGSSLREGGFNFGDDEEDEEDDFEDDDGDDEPVDDEELEDDQLDGDVFGASADEGGPEKSFPPDDSEDLDGLPTPGEEMLGAGEGGEGDDDMAAVLGGIDPDLAGLGDDKGGGFGGSMGGIGGMGGGPGGEMGDLGDALGGEMGGDEMGGLGGDDMGGLTDLTAGDDMGGLGGDDMGAMGEPCPDCNPDGVGEPDPECQTCAGEGFLDDEMGGEMGGGEIEDAELDPSIDKMNFLSKMTNYQKKYMPAAAAAAPVAGAAARMAPQLGIAAAKMVPQIAGSAIGQMAPQMLNARPQGGQQPQFSRKFMGRKFMGKACGPKKHMSACCHENVGTYKETHSDFLANLAANAKGDVRKKWSSGISEDALLQAVDPNAHVEPQAGQPGFAPQGRIGAVGAGGYTQQDIKDIPVLGESKRYPSLDEYTRAKNAAKKASKKRR